MSETSGVGNVCKSDDPIIRALQDDVIERDSRIIQESEARMPRGILGRVAEMRAQHFHSGRVHLAQLSIISARRNIECRVPQIAATISAKREQVPIIKAFFDTSSSPDSGTIAVSQLGDKEQTAARGLQARIRIAATEEGHGIGHPGSKPLPLFDSQRPLIDSADGNTARVTVAVLGELGLQPRDFVETDENTGAITVMEAVTPYRLTQGQGITSRSIDRYLRVRYEQQGLDASLTLTVEQTAPQSIVASLPTLQT